MRTKNFPEKKNERRKKALENLKKYALENPSTSLEKAIKNTEDKIVQSAISVKTKIRRSKTG